MAQDYSGVSANPPQPHFLDACSLCRKPLAFNSDIFMYRGNTPFCSKECRQEQIEMDESREKKGWKVASSTSLRKSEQTTTDSSATKALRTSRVVVA